jgi:hypothetical protein
MKRKDKLPTNRKETGIWNDKINEDMVKKRPGKHKKSRYLSKIIFLLLVKNVSGMCTVRKIQELHEPMLSRASN